MQPHSMCALALANLVWNQGYGDSIAFSRILVEYQTPKGTYKKNYYDLNQIKVDGDKFSVAIKRSGGGLACTMDVKKNSSDEVEMTHRTQHIAGLMERFTLDKKRIRKGDHRNSRKYNTFAGDITQDTNIELVCDVLSLQQKKFIKIPYTLSIDSLQLKK